jgi:hypothetical protein
MTKTLVPVLPFPPAMPAEAVTALSDEQLKEMIDDASEVHKEFDKARGAWLTYWCKFYDEANRRAKEAKMREKLIPELRAELEAKIRAELSNANTQPETANESR